MSIKIKLKRKLLFIIFGLAISINVFAFQSDIYVNTQNVPSPYFSYNVQNEPEGFIFDLFQNLNEDVYDLVFTSDSSKLKGNNFAYGYITRDEVPKGFQFIEIPHQLVYYVFTRKGADIISLNNLFNKKVIVLKDDLPYKLLYANKTSYILTVKSYKQALLKLSSGINECAIIPYQIGMKIIEDEKLENLEHVITPFLSFDFGIAVPNNKVDVISQFKEGLNNSLENNAFKLIEKKWFVNASNFNSEWNDSKRMLVLVMVLLVLIIIVLFGFIQFLINEMHASTNDYIRELRQSNISPLNIDINNPQIQRLLSSAPLWLMVNDLEGNVKHISNELLLDTLNIDTVPDDLKVSTLFNSDLTNLLTSLDEKLTHQISKIHTQEIEFEIDGRKFNKWLIKYPLRIHGNNKPLFLSLFIRPLVEGDAEFRFLSTQFLFNSVIDALPDLIFIKNIKGTYLGGNRAFFNFCGKSESEIVGKTDLQIFEKEKYEKYSKSDKIVFKAGLIWEGQEWDSLQTGENVRFENVKIPLRNKKNEIFGLVGISHDVTRHHKYELELAQAKEKAEESDRVKSSFMTNMSHEIRTPMNSIIGFSDLLADPDLTMDQRIEIIDMIQSNGHTLIDLIDDIIDFSRIEAGQIHLKFGDFNLNAIFKDAYNFGISKKTQLNKEHLNIAYSIGSMEDEFMIHSDPFRLRQVLKNLLNSSIRFSTSESLYFGYFVKDTKLIMYIKNDNNIISDELMEKIMSNTMDFNYSFSEIEESTGIALIIAKNVIEMINGQLYSEELNPGRPDFYFSMPLERVENRAQVNAQPSTFEIPNWLGNVILIAEDEETNYILLDGILSNTQAELLRANNGKEAIELYQANMDRISFVLMDIRMPEINGVEASRKILEINPQAIIIAQTAYAMPEDKDQYINLGMKAVLAKPLDPSELYYVCKRFLSK